MTRFIENYGTLTTYQGFIENMKNSLYIMQDLKGHLEKITEFKVSFNKITEIGFIMKHFYDLYEDPTYNKVFLYSFGFHGYMNNLDGLKKNIDEQHISYATFDKNTNKTADESKFKSKTKAETKFKKAYYPALISKNPVKNDYKLEKNLIITGPNASGKTTVLKSAIINLVLSQQWGCGCYETANIKPFKYIHCYLNIPDTSGRDSLFQAEARRCKEIIDCVNQNKEDSHFAVFDELYSGTNPEEAVISARAFMEYLVKNENVKCILTTHYIKLCKQLGKTKTIKNYNMKTIKKNDNFEYTYSLIEGISKTKGGLKVLTDMNYPKEIIDQTNELMK
jgi:DNA mismatch repair ATPase MutS